MLGFCITALLCKFTIKSTGEKIENRLRCDRVTAMNWCCPSFWGHRVQCYRNVCSFSAIMHARPRYTTLSYSCDVYASITRGILRVIFPSPAARRFDASSRPKASFLCISRPCKKNNDQIFVISLWIYEAIHCGMRRPSDRRSWRAWSTWTVGGGSRQTARVASDRYRCVSYKR